MKRFLMCVLMTAASVTVLTGCGYLRFRLPGHERPRGELPPVTLKVGERQLAIGQRVGTAIAGGHFPGLASADPDIVAVERKSKGTGADTFIIGKTPGTTRLYYLPSPGNPAEPANDETIARATAFFNVTVTTD